MDFLLHHLLQSSADRNPAKEAVVHGDRRLSYAELCRRVNRLGAGLRDLGVMRGDRVGIFLEPSCTLAEAIFAISRAGGAFVPIHPSLFPDQVAHIVRDCEMTGLITDGTRYDRLGEALRSCPSLRFVACTEGDRHGSHALRVVDLASLANARELVPGDDRSIGHDLAAILYTSGSTGKPKGVMLSHANVIAGASIVSDYLGITSQDRILAALPMSFDAGLNQLTTAIQQGGTLVLLQFLLAREVVDALLAEQITGLAGVPPFWSLMAQPSSTLKARAPALRYITNTGGAMPPGVLGKLREALPSTQVFLMYGLTEAFRSTYLPPEELDRRPTSMGKAIPDTEILVVDDQGRLCGPGDVGELVHHGPTVSMGYWGHPELTNKVLRPHPCPTPGLPPTVRVCYSGDLVRTDEDGFLYFVARRDNQIKSSGFRVSPTEVEEALCAGGRLQHAAVVGVPDDVLGQRIEAFGILAEGVSVDPAEVLADCATRLPRYMVPRMLELLGELPRTSSGKTDYVALRQRAIARGQTAGDVGRDANGAEAADPTPRERA